MKLFIFTLLCLSVVVLSFLDFLAAKPTTVFSYLVMYGDFFKSFLNIEKKYFIQTLLMTLFIVTSSWCLIPALLKQLHVSKKLVRNILMTFSGIFFIYLSFFRIGIQDLFIIFFQKTSFYEDNYIFYSLKNDNLPERKKNLILIFAESLEQSYANPDLFPNSLLPELTKQAGLSFSEFLQTDGTDNTISALTAALCAIPVMPVLPEFSRNHIKFTFPSALCLTDVLNKAGYDTYFYFSETEHFSNKVNLLKEHGIKNVIGATTLRRNEDDNGLTDFSAVKDSKTFEVAKEKILELSQKKSPFFMGILTINTHEPVGYLEKNCQTANNTFNEFARIVFCTDRQISDFIDFIKKTPLFHDTVIAVVGDHLARQNPLYETLEKNRHRLIFNRFINIPTPLSANRSFSMLDLTPTLLEAAGFPLPEKGFGLGRSLLSQEQTLIEKYGIQHMKKEMLKNSAFYKDLLKNKKTDQ